MRNNRTTAAGMQATARTQAERSCSYEDNWNRISCKLQLPMMSFDKTFHQRRKTKVVKRLDQGHLHPKLEVPGLTCPGRESNRGLHGGRRAL